MRPPRLLRLAEVLVIHAEMIDRYGGETGLRDRGLLESALAMPSMSFGGKPLHPDPYLMAAAYLFHLVRNHPFVDGNKRTAVAAAIVFLDLNGISIEADEDGLVEITLRAAEGRATKRELADFFRDRVR